MSLQDIENQQFDGDVFRVDNHTNPRSMLENEGLSPEQVFEMVRFAKLPQDKASDTIFRIFTPMPRTPPHTDGRFGDGTFPVLYCAVEDDTAIREKLHYLASDDWFSRGYPLSFQVFQVPVSAPAKDLRSGAYARADLVSEDPSVCRQIGGEAHQTGVHLLLSFSARVQNGTTSPVFRADAIQGQVVSRPIGFQMTAAGPTVLN